MTFRLTGPLLLVLTFAAVAAGCGSGSDGGEGAGDSGDDGISVVSTTIPTSSIDKAQFVKQVNAICKSGKSSLAKAVIAYQKKHLNEASTKVVPNAARTVIEPELQAQIEQIRALGAPRGDAGEIEKFFTALVDGVDEIVKKKPPTFDEAERLFYAADGRARKYGIDQCEYVLVDPRFNTRVLNSE